MRLNGKKILDIMAIKGQIEEKLCKAIGLYPKSFRWILKDGFASEEAAERIAEAIGVSLREILLPEISGNIENMIEFIKDNERATVTFSQGRYKSRIKKLAAERPEECEIVAENADGSLCAHIPTAWVKIIPSRQFSEEQRQELVGRLGRK